MSPAKCFFASGKKTVRHLKKSGFPPEKKTLSHLGKNSLPLEKKGFQVKKAPSRNIPEGGA